MFCLLILGLFNETFQLQVLCNDEWYG